jgi:hypothetical protein
MSFLIGDYVIDNGFVAMQAACDRIYWTDEHFEIHS